MLTPVYEMKILFVLFFLMVSRVSSEKPEYSFIGDESATSDARPIEDS